LENLEYLEDTFLPPDWAVTAGNDLIKKGETSAYSGDTYVYMNDSGIDWFRTNQLTDISSIRFMGKASSATSSFTITLQYSSNGSTWTPIQSWSANGSDTGDITSTYASLTSNFDMPGTYYYRWSFLRTSGYFYMDNIELGRSVDIRDYHVNSLDVGYTASSLIQGLNPDTDYCYVVKGVKNGTIGYESNEIAISTPASQPYGFPQDVAVPIDDISVTFNTGDANLIDAETSSTPNPAFVPVFARVLDLIGPGPWEIDISASTATYPWITYKHGGTWRTMSNTSGTVSFQIDATKENLLEIQAGSGDNPTLPVVLPAFTAIINPHNYVSLNLVTQSETNSLGYYVYRADTNDLQSALMVSDLIEATNTSQLQVYCFTDEESLGMGTYWYWLESRDLDGSFSFHGPVSLSVGDIDTGSPPLPSQTRLDPPYPNPFNPVTQIRYQLARDMEVSIRIYNLRGQAVRKFPMISRSAGNHTIEWNGKDDAGMGCSSGIYRIVMEAGGESFVRKVALVK